MWLVSIIHCFDFTLFSSWVWMRFCLYRVLHSSSWLHVCSSWFTITPLKFVPFWVLFPAILWWVYGPRLMMFAPIVKLFLVTMENKFGLLFITHWRILFPFVLEQDLYFRTFHLNFISLLWFHFKHWDSIAYVILSKIYFYHVGLAGCFHSCSWDLWVCHWWFNLFMQSGKSLPQKVCLELTRIFVVFSTTLRQWWFRLFFYFFSFFYLFLLSPSLKVLEEWWHNPIKGWWLPSLRIQVR